MFTHEEDERALNLQQDPAEKPEKVTGSSQLLGALLLSTSVGLAPLLQKKWDFSTQASMGSCCLSLTLIPFSAHFSQHWISEGAKVGRRVERPTEVPWKLE